MNEGGGFKEFIRYCTSPLCNDWDGISENRPGGGSGGGGDGGGGSGGDGSGGDGSGGDGSGGDGSGGDGSGGGGNSSRCAIGGGGSKPLLFVGIGSSGPRNQRMDLYLPVITFSVVLKLYW